MKRENVSFLNKNYQFVKGNITVENNIITELEEFENTDEYGIIPNYTDIHIHGGYGVDVMDCDENKIAYLAQKLIDDNVGLWLPTTVAKDFDSIIKTAEAVKKAANLKGVNNIGGIHIEGPFISKKYKGIMEDKYIAACDTRLFDDLKEIMGDMIIRFTVAPEADGAEEFCRYVVKNGGFVSMGHSAASYEQCKNMVDCGANSFTHIFNAMPSLHHRDENILAYALDSDLFCEIIADEIHIKPMVLKLALHILGERAVLITDALRPMGLGEGKFEFCGAEITVSNRRAVNSDGRLAGSVLKMQEAVDIASKYIGYKNALKLACENPPKVIDMFDKIGSIEVGKKLFINQNNINWQPNYVEKP